MSFEDSFLGRLDRKRAAKPVESFVLQRAHSRALEILNDPAYSIRPEEFEDLYGSANIAADAERVEQRKRNFHHQNSREMQETKNASEVFEAMFLEQAELSNWLGENVTLQKSAEFDDIFNGVDLIAEWKKESQVLALGVDLTFGFVSAQDKLAKNRESIDRMKLSTIKYFRHSDHSFRGEKRGVPNLVIGLDKGNVSRLAELWEARNKRALAMHPVQRAVIEQICAQLRYGAAYARRKGLTPIADSFTRALATAEHVRSQKRAIDLGPLAYDKVHRSIMEHAERSLR